jgi:UDP-N-acetylmuramoylalanine--D-glutamate ligase
MKQAYVIGLGKSGIAASRLLKTDGWDVTLSDTQQTDMLQHQAAALLAAGIKVRLGETLSGAAGGWATTDAPQRLVISPGVPWDLPTLNQARA